jgi:serine/threonine-protein kinase
MELLNRYRVVQHIGRGGFGAIYLVEDTAVQDRIIFKILNSHLSEDEGAIRRFVQELKLTRKITHRNVIRIYDLIDLGGAHAVSMEYFPGRDLGKVLTEAGKLDPWRSLGILAQACDGLAAAHEAGVVHRDIKPGNILVGVDDEVKIVDFGLAWAEQRVGSRLTKSGLLIGTPEYMAPEQIRGEEADHRVDVYGLGIVLYEMITGRPPFTAETPVKILFQHLEGEARPMSELSEGVPPEIEALTAAAMAREPDERIGSAVELGERIRDLLDASPLEPRRRHG